MTSTLTSPNFNDLSLELLVEVISYFDYDTILALATTDKWYHDTLHQDKIYQYLGWKNQGEHQSYCLECGDVAIAFVTMVNPLVLIRRAFFHDHKYRKIPGLLDYMSKNRTYIFQGTQEDYDRVDSFLMRSYHDVINGTKVDLPELLLNLDEQIFRYYFERLLVKVKQYYREIRRNFTRDKSCHERGYFADYEHLYTCNNLIPYLFGAILGYNHDLIRQIMVRIPTEEVTRVIEPFNTWFNQG